MPIKEVTVHTLGELIDHVTPAEPDPITGRRRDAGVYRGTSDSSHALLTTLDRLGGTSPPHRKGALEEHILRNFVRYSRAYLPATHPNDWELLVAAQHHGVPTRLLDWTYSPLVAAYFATRPFPERPECNRAVWRLDWQRVHDAFGFPKLALLIEDLDELFGGHGGFTPWRLFEWDSARTPFACMLEPPSLDERIVAQAAAFTVCSDRTVPLDDFLETHGLGDTLTRFVIPAAQVAHLRDQLDLAGVDERRLFPGLDGLAATIHRYYS